MRFHECLRTANAGTMGSPPKPVWKVLAHGQGAPGERGGQIKMIPLVHNKAVTDGLPVLVPVTSAEQREALRAAAAADGHPGMLLPTHVMLRGQEIVGCTSLGAVVLAHSWLHTEKLRPLETVRLFSLVENVARAVGYKALCVPVPESSPMFERMTGRFGFQLLGQSALFAKVLAHEGKD